MFIDSNSIVRLCCSSGKALIPMADLNEESDLKKVWYNEKFTTFRKKLLFGQTKGTVCQKCIGRNIDIASI